MPTQSQFAIVSPGKLNVPYKAAGSFGNKFIVPIYLICHYTAGRGFDSTVARFAAPDTKASAHFVVGRKGQIVQMVPLDRPAWHAGADSAWTPRRPAPVAGVTLEHLNFYSVGIEFDNFGPLRKVGKVFRTWFGSKVSPSEVAEVDPKLSTSFGHAYWHAYSEEQLWVAEKLIVFLTSSLKLLDVLGHSDVCPFRKQDPGPVFPLSHLRAIAFGRSEDESEKITKREIFLDT